MRFAATAPFIKLQPEARMAWTVSTRRFLVIAAIFVAYAVLGVIFLHWFGKTEKPWRIWLFEDFGYYVRGLDRAAAHTNPYSDKSIGTGFLYPPPALLWTWAFARLSFHAKIAALLSWQALSLGLCIGMLYREFGRRALLAAPFWVFSVATVLTIFLGQINLLVLLGIVTLYVFEERRPWLAGLGLATAICVKFSPIIFVVYLLLRRRWLTFAWTLGFCLAWSALTAGCFGLEPFRRYPDMIAYLSSLAGYGASISGFTAYVPHLGSHTAQRAVQRLVGALCVLMVILTSLLSNRTKDRQPAFMAACVSLLIVPGIVWQHQAIWLLLPLTLFWFRAGCSPAVLMSTFMIVQVECFYHGLLLTHGVSLFIVLAAIVMEPKPTVPAAAPSALPMGANYSG